MTPDPTPRGKLSHLLPYSVRLGARKVLFQGAAVTCQLCGSTVRGFHENGGTAEVLTRRRVVGGRIRQRDACPVCHAASRTRLMALYLKRLLKDAATRLRVLHVAPDPGLYIWLRRDSRVDYMATDLDRRRYRHIADFTEGNLMHLPFKTGEFDLVICSHVLEHVPDDRKAMSEILRVLKPLGQAMLMVPMATDGGEIDEDPAIVDAAERDRRFGQWDHVRLYTPDEFARRLEATGFQVERYAARDLQPDAAESASIDPDELLMIGRPKV